MRPSLHKPGHISVLLIFYMNAVLMLLAIIWIAGDLSEQRLRAQQAADAAAHSGTLWMARAANALTAANVLQVRNGSARVLAVAAPFVIAETAEKLIPHLKAAIAVCLIYPEYLEEVCREIVCLLNFARKTLPVSFSYMDLRRKAYAVHDFQTRLIGELPAVIEVQRAALEDIYKCEIALSQPNGGGRIASPFRTAGSERYSIAVPLYQQVTLDRQGWLDDAWGIGQVYLAGGAQSWRHWTDVMTVAIMLDTPHVVLATHPAFPAGVLFESMPSPEGILAPFRASDVDVQQHFTVVAAARTRGDSGLPTLFSGQLASAAPPAAFAQAEMFNLAEAHPQYAYRPYPWRLFSMGGWNWMPRLTVSHSLRQTIENSPGINEILGGAKPGENHVPLH